MLERLIEIALKNRGWILGIFAVSVLSGAMALKDLPIDAVPDITNVQVVINTQTGALDPENVELLVTRPVELELSGLPKLEEMRSISKFGLSQITLVFHEGTDIYWARQQVFERIQNSKKEIPKNISPELAPITTGLGEVFMYSVQSESPLGVDILTELRGIQDFIIRPRLRRISGVADVDSNGGYEKQIHINFYPDRLEKLGLTLDQLRDRLETLGENFGGGYIQKDQKQVIVRTTPNLNTLHDLENLTLGVMVSGRPILLKDIASVREDHAQRLGSATVNGKETVLGTVLMQTGANSRSVAEEVSQALDTLELPHGIKIQKMYSRSFLVNATIHTVQKSLLEGALLVIGVLLLLLGHWRAAVIVAIAIPVSMLVAARGMLISGISGNLMSLGAIDFGLLVDGSVVLIENLIARTHLLKTNPTLQERRQWVIDGSKEVIRPIVFGLCMIMAVYLPILSLEGVEGKMFRPMALTVLFALLVSLFVAIFLMPILAEFFLSKKSKSESTHAHETRFFLFLKSLYVPSLNWALKHPIKVVSSSGVVLILAIVALMNTGSDFIPQLQEGDLVIGVTRTSGIDIDTATQEQKAVEDLIREFLEVQTVFSRLGTPASATDPMGPHLADTFLILEKDRSKWSVQTVEELFEKIKIRLSDKFPNNEYSATQPIEMRFNEMLEGSRADVSIRFLGSDLQHLYESSQKAEEILSQLQGIESLSTDPLTALKTSPVLSVLPKSLQQSKYGITLKQLNETFQLAMGGETVGSFNQNNRRLPIILHLDESLRDQTDVIQNLPVPLPSGGTIPLKLIAELQEKEQVTTIARNWGDRYAALAIQLKDRDIDSFVKEAKAKLDEQFKNDSKLKLQWGGQFKNLARAKEKLFWIVPLTLLGIFIILLRNFGNLSETFLVFGSIPFATCGGVFALWIRGLNFSVSAAVGFIALIGIALLNALVLIQILKDHSNIIEAATSRLRPVMMTALVASLGFLPMALNTGLGAEVQRPLATVVIGGLITATLLTLIVLPVGFSWIHKKTKSG